MNGDGKGSSGCSHAVSRAFGPHWHTPIGQISSKAVCDRCLLRKGNQFFRTPAVVRVHSILLRPNNSQWRLPSNQRRQTSSKKEEILASALMFMPVSMLVLIQFTLLLYVSTISFMQLEIPLIERIFDNSFSKPGAH